jgi:2-polyprenyl-3-methyl-5-hydroxy-6-metoxy-1,4-benzoquinol methylase
VQALAKAFIPPSSNVLDFCCGQGSVVKALAEMGHTVFGVDKEQSHINHAALAMPGCHVFNKSKLL